MKCLILREGKLILNTISSPESIMNLTEPVAKRLERTMIATTHVLLPIIMNNVRENFELWRNGKNVSSLPRKPNTPCIVVGAGPTLWKKNHLKLLKKAKWSHAIIASDRMLIPLLKKRIIPDYVGSVDPRVIIKKFYDDPIVDKHADKVKAILPVTTNPEVANRFKGEIYWWVPRMDEMREDMPQSLTKALHYLCDKGIVFTGGNAGTFCLSLACGLEYNPVILIGLDLSYDTLDRVKTTFYEAIERDFGGDKEKIEQEFVEGYNPIYKKPFLIDTVFQLYRYNTLRFINASSQTIINCTEGGSLFGGRLKCEYFKDVLKRYGGKITPKKKETKIVTPHKRKGKLKIGLISTPFLRTPADTYGGLETVVANLGEALAKMGHDVTVFAADGSKVKGCEVVEFGPPALKVQVNWLEAERKAYEIYKNMLKDFDIINSHDWFSFCYASKVKNPSLRIAHSHHGGLSLSWWKRSVPPFKLNLIAISDWMVKVYASQGFTAKRVYNGIDLKQYPFKKKKGERLIFVGRFDKFKQPHIAIEIAKKLDLGLDLVGGTFVQDPSYLERIKGLCDGKQIKMYPDASHEVKLKLLQNAKALLFPSKMGEPFGLVAVEAMACGTIPICLLDGAIPEVVKEGGYVCNDVDAMADMVKQVHKISPRACRNNAQRFSREQMAKGYLTLYKEIIYNNNEW